MTCSPVKLPDGTRAIVCHKGAPIQQCSVDGCFEFATHACDWKVGERQDGTCSMPMCDKHRTNVGKGKDLCPRHASEWAHHPANRQPELEFGT